MKQITRIAFTLVIFFATFFSGSLAQSDFSLPITANNAAEVSSVARFGYGAITDIAFSPDGQYFAVGTRIGIALYGTGDLSKPPKFLEGRTTSVAFSPDSAILASDGQVWNPHTGEVAYALEGYSPAFSPDGGKVVTAYTEDVIISDAESGHELERQNVGYYIHRLVLSPDGGIVALEGDNGFGLWNLETKTDVSNLATPQYPMEYGVSTFSPDGTLLLHAGWNGFAAWKLDTGEITFQQDSWFDPGLNAVAFDPQGQRFAIGDADANISLYDANTGQPEISFRHDDEVISVAFNHTGTVLAAAAINGVVKLWDVETQEELAHLSSFINPGQVIGFSNDDEIITVASIGGTAWRWNADTGEQTSVAQGYFFGASHGTVPYPASIALNQRATLLATGDSIDGIIRLWTPQGQSRGHFELGLGVDVLDTIFTADNRRLAALTHSGVFIWELETGTLLTGLRIRSEHRISGITFSPDGQTLAIGDSEGVVTLRNVETGRTTAVLQGSDGDATNAIFSPDGTVIAFTNYCYSCVPENRDYAIRLWSVTAGNLLRSFQGHSDFVEGLAFSRDGSVLASISKDGTLRLWNTNTGEQLAVIQEQASALAFSHSGTLLATSSTDGAIRLWGIPS